MSEILNEQELANMFGNVFSKEKTNDEIAIDKVDPKHSKLNWAQINPNKTTEGYVELDLRHVPNFTNQKFNIIPVDKYNVTIDGESVILYLPPKDNNFLNEDGTQFTTKLSKKISKLFTRVNNTDNPDPIAKAIIGSKEKNDKGEEFFKKGALEWDHSEYGVFQIVNEPLKPEVNGTFVVVKIVKTLKPVIKKVTNLSDTDIKKGKKALDIWNPLRSPLLTIRCGMDGKFRNFSSSDYDRDDMKSIMVGGKHLEIVDKDFTEMTPNRVAIMTELYSKCKETFEILTFTPKKYDLEVEAKILDWIEKIESGLIPLDNMGMEYSMIGKSTNGVTTTANKVTVNEEVSKQNTTESTNTVDNKAIDNTTSGKSQTTASLLSELED